MYSCPSNLCMSIAIYCVLTVGTRVGLVCVCVRVCVRVIGGGTCRAEGLKPSQLMWIQLLETLS